MKEKLDELKQQIKLLWMNSSKKQKTLFFSISGILVALIVVITIVTSTKQYVPLYTNLSLHEVGQIKEELDGRKINF